MCKSIVEAREKYYDIGLKKGYEQGRTKGYRGAFLEIYAIEFAKGYVEGYQKEAAHTDSAGIRFPVL